REVGVVLRLVGGKRILPHPVEATIGVDVPQRIERRLLQAVGLAAGVDRPDVEPAGVFDGAFGIFQDQGLVARQIGKQPLGHGSPGEQGKAEAETQTGCQWMRLKPHRTFLLALARAPRLLLGLRRGKRYTSPPASNKPILRGANAPKAIVEPSRPSRVR